MYVCRCVCVCNDANTSYMHRPTMYTCIAMVVPLEARCKVLIMNILCMHAIHGNSFRHRCDYTEYMYTCTYNHAPKHVHSYVCNTFLHKFLSHIGTCIHTYRHRHMFTFIHIQHSLHVHRLYIVI